MGGASAKNAGVLTLKDQELDLREIQLRVFSILQNNTVMHGHSFAEIAVVVAGKGLHRAFNEEPTPLRRGDVLFVPYGAVHAFQQVDGLRLISMCLVHDLPEARIGDQNYVQKKYVKVDEEKAVADATRNLPFGPDLADLIREFNAQETLESRLARDADQLSFLLNLKSIADVGHKSPDLWIPVVRGRLKTEIGKRLADEIMATSWDAWWMNGYSE